jgi:hypothetical protein
MQRRRFELEADRAVDALRVEEMIRVNGLRRAGEAVDDGGLAGEDEGTMQGNHGAVDVRPADDE